MAKHGQWDDAHKLVQQCSDELSCLIHGYLHWVEGNLGNAGYWYRRAGTDIPHTTPEAELERLYTMLDAS
jgi:hypothetical protein